jgi:hypothetical protein
VGVATVPSETDPPPIVDPDAVLSGPITLQPLQPVARWHAKIVQSSCCVYHPELPECHLLHFRPEPPSRSSVEHPLSVPVAEALDHDE